MVDRSLCGQLADSLSDHGKKERECALKRLGLEGYALLRASPYSHALFTLKTAKVRYLPARISLCVCQRV